MDGCERDVAKKKSKKKIYSDRWNERERENKEHRAPQKGIKGPQLGFHILINIELKEGH